MNQTGDCKFHKLFHRSTAYHPLIPYSGQSTTSCLQVSVKISFRKIKYYFRLFNAFNMFSFTNVSSSSRTRSQRKRPNSSSAENESQIESSKRSKKEDPRPLAAYNQRNDSAVVLSDDAEQTPPPKQPVRKRKAAGKDDNLFAFNTNFVKKVKPAKPKSQLPSAAAASTSGLIPLKKTTTSSTLTYQTTYSYENDDSNDSGVWLSKKMLSARIDGGENEIKPEAMQEPEQLDDSEFEATQRPRVSGPLFDVLETSASVISTTSTLSKVCNFQLLISLCITTFIYFLAKAVCQEEELPTTKQPRRNEVNDTRRSRRRGIGPKKLLSNFMSSTSKPFQISILLSCRLGCDLSFGVKASSLHFTLFLLTVNLINHLYEFLCRKESPSEFLARGHYLPIELLA